MKTRMKTAQILGYFLSKIKKVGFVLASFRM
jgi:hypothetical protein